MARIPDEEIARIKQPALEQMGSGLSVPHSSFLKSI